MHWFFVINNALAMGVAVLLARLLFPRAESWRRVLAAVAGFPAIIILTLLLLGNTGLMSAPAAGGMLAAAAAVLVFLAWRRRPPVPHASEERAVENGPIGRVLFCLAFALLAHIMWNYTYQAAAGPTFFSYDDLRYHAPPAAHWLQDGSFSLVPCDYHGYFPFNAELFTVWFMLPFSGDALASLSGLTWTVVAAVALAGLAASRGTGRLGGVLAPALFLSSSVIAYAATTFSAVDIVGAAPVLAAVAFAVPVLAGGSHVRWPSALYCGLLVGLAAGARTAAVPCAVVLGVWWLCHERQQMTLKQRARLAAIYAAGVVATGAFFYVRTAYLTGNPLFPAAVGPFGGPFGAEQGRTKLITWILDAPVGGALWSTLVKEYTAWPIPLFVVAVIGYGSAIWALVRGRLRGTELLVLCLGLLLILLHPLMPFSATNNRPDYPLRIRQRFIVTSFGMGTLLFTFLLARDPRRRNLWAGLGLLAVGLALPEVTVRVVVLAAGLAVGFFWDSVARLLRPAPVRWLLAALVLVGLLFLVPEKQRRTDEEIHEYGNKNEPIGAAWQALEALPAGSRIAWLGGHSHPYYPLFGRRLQFRPVALDRDGTPAVPLHVRWQRDPEGTPWWEDEEEPPLGQLMANLLAADVDYVLVSRWRRPDWPAQYGVLKRSGQAECVYDDGFSSIWRLRRETR